MLTKGTAGSTGYAFPGGFNPSVSGLSTVLSGDRDEEMAKTSDFVRLLEETQDEAACSKGRRMFTGCCLYALLVLKNC